MLCGAPPCPLLGAGPQWFPMWWDHTGAGVEQGWTDVSPALESRQLPLLWGGVEGVISYLPPSSCLESCWWEVGPGVGPPVLGRALCPPVPFPPALSTTASFRDCCQIFVPPASPERGVLGAGVGS